MTKEPIMIDDVDVAECEYFSSKLGYCNIGLWANDGTHICECEPNCYYKQLKRKEEELTSCRNELEWLHNINDQLKAENEKMSKGYIELTEILNPYIDAFTGYNEELKGFDIVLCVKEFMEQFAQTKGEVHHKTEYIKEQRDIIDQLKVELEQQKALKQTYLTCYKTKHGDVKNKLFKYEIYKQALQEIKNLTLIAKTKQFVDMEEFWEQILQKCEVIKDEV